MNILLGFLSLFLLVEWPLSGSAMPSIHGANENQIYSPHILNKDKIAPYSHNSLLQRTAVANPLINNDHSHNQHGVYYHSQINLKPKDLPKKTLHFAGTAPLKSYGTQQNRNKKDETVQKWNAAATDVQKSLRPKDTVKKTTLSSKPRLTRNQGDQKKKKKQYIVANLGGLALGNGLALGIGGTPTASYGASLGTGYGANLAGNYGTGLGTMLVTGYGSEGDNGVLTNRQTFGTNYGANSNSQSSTALGDLAGFNSLNSQAGLNYLSNLDSLGGTTDLNSLNSINQYQNSDLDILSSNANNGLDGFGSLTTGTAQNHRYAGHNALGSSLNSLQGKLTAAGGNRQGIGSMDLGMDDLGGNGMSDSSLQQILGQIMNGMGGDGGGGGRMGGHMRNSNSNDDLGGDVGNLDLGSLGVNLGMGNEVGNGMGNGVGNGMGNGIGSRIGNGLGNGMENGLGNSIEELGGMGNNMGHEMGGMGNGLPNGMANSMENMGGAGGAGLAMGMGGMGEMGSMNQVGGMGHGFKIGGIHFGGHAAGTMGNQEESNTEMEDAQTSDSPDEQAFPGLMHRPLAIAPIVPGQTVHAHASDKPKRPKYPTMDISPVEMALKVQLKAHREHQRKLKELKMKLRRLREKLRKLKADYNYNDDEEETEKSEMETLKDLKQATEQAIRELQEEAVRASKRKGLKKLIFIHNIPDSKGHKPEFGKTNTLEDLGTDLLALIDSNTNKPTSGPVRDGPTRSRPPVFIPAAPTTERAEKKGPLHDDTQSLTQLEKQAEQEVDYIADKKKVKQQSLNTGLKIKIPEAVPVTQKGNAHAAVMTLKESTAPQASLPVHMRPQVIKTPDGQRLLNPIQLNNLAQILPEPVDNTRERKFQQSRPTGNGTMERKHAPDYFSIGCWRDQPQRALPSLEGIFPMLDGNDYKARQFAIKKCSVIARVQGFPAFALENGGQCLGGKDILETYNMYGASGACKRDGKGGPWSMEVYKFIRHIPARRGSISRIENQHRLSLSRSRP